MAAYLDLTVEQGATLTFELNVVDDDTGEPIDLTGYTARMAIKYSAVESDALLSLTTENGRILIAPASGGVTLYLSATDTAAITWRNAVYDLELVNAEAQVTRLVAGAVRVSPEVTA